VEFGIFLQGHVPHRKLETNPDYEHTSFLNDIALAKAADRSGFKYIWVSEHHFLEEYSHISANEVFLGYLAAATERIHLASGIFNITPQVNHPVRNAERAAMLDHLTEGRFEMGTGRGAGSLEVTGFGIEDNKITKEIYDEVIGEFAKMWTQDEYSFDGKYFKLPPRNVLPKPYAKPHPPLWMAAGNPPSFEKAAQLGMGVLGFNMASIDEMKPMIDAYKNAIGNAEPVGKFVNDNVMVTNTAVVLEDGQKAREVAAGMGIGRHNSLVYRYHDTFPKPPWVPQWPETLPEPSVELIDTLIEKGMMVCGTPDEVVEQMERYAAVGPDQLVFGLPNDMPIEAAIETIELFGEHVLPKFDTDSVHRSTRHREAAAAAASSDG
jgi:alkanesulfonate monooxygenase SsuD/methylene tetrahydromethanopterin reductase-like flavin-dependent oxidoreductase (luciferase family)